MLLLGKHPTAQQCLGLALVTLGLGLKAFQPTRGGGEDEDVATGALLVLLAAALDGITCAAHP